MAKRDKETKDTGGVDKASAASSRADSTAGKGAGTGEKPRKKKRRPAEAPEGAAAPESGAADDEAVDTGSPAVGEPEVPDDDLAEAADHEDAAAEGDDGDDGDGGDGDGEDGDEEEDDEEVAAAQLGIEKYVMAGFFATGMLVAFLTGRFTHLVWAQLSNRDWFSRALPSAAAVSDDSKLTYGTIFGAVVALVAVIRSYRSPRVRAWTDEVAGELSKVKWPNKKEVTSSTVTVLAASAVATTYLALLDRLWGFVTNLVYGTGT